MKTIHLLAALCGIGLVFGCFRPAFAQYDLTPDTTKPATQDSTKLPADSLKQDTTGQDTAKALPQGEPETPVGSKIPAPESGALPTNVASDASTWLKRLLFRGHLDATEIGAFASYQLTAWDEKVGSYGPVEANLTVYYLGTSEWLGRDAEWLQAVYQTVEGEPTTVEFDLIVPSSSEVRAINRLLYRVDRGEMKTMNFALPADQLDYDAADKPTDEGADQIKLYSGTYDVNKFRGSGSDGSTVVIYRSKTVPPLDVVRLGYGDEGLTLTGTGSDATPRMDVAPPPSTGVIGDTTQPR